MDLPVASAAPQNPLSHMSIGYKLQDLCLRYLGTVACGNYS